MDAVLTIVPTIDLQSHRIVCGSQRLFFGSDEAINRAVSEHQLPFELAVQIKSVLAQSRREPIVLAWDGPEAYRSQTIGDGRAHCVVFQQVDPNPHRGGIH